MSSENFLESRSALEFANLLSSERLSIYRKHADDCLDAALRLYAWNTAMCAAFYGPLQGLEVALRNAMHRELSWKYGPNWFDNAGTGLAAGAQRRIREVKKGLRRAGKPIEPPNVVAALSFGFWVSLTDSGDKLNSGCQTSYEDKLWRPALRRAFPSCNTTLTRRQAHERLNRIREFRNRIAHHEPIFNKNPDCCHETILEVTEWISPGTAEWIRAYSRVSELLALKDKDQAIRF